MSERSTAADDAAATGERQPTGDSERPHRATAWTPEPLERLRADPTRRRVALAAAALVGLAAAWVHWLGLFVAGALVGLVSRDLPRAVAAGLGVGVLVLAAHVLASPAMSAGEFLGLGQPAYLAVGAGLLLPAWGALVRSVV